MKKIVSGMHIKTIISFILIIFSITMFAGCSNKPASKIEQTTNTEKTAYADVTVKYPIQVKDFRGYTLNIPKMPTSIVSLTLATDEMLIELIDVKRIKAIDLYAEDEGISNIVEFAKSFPTKIDANIEKIISLKPDLVFIADWKEKEFVQQLRDANIPVYVFKTPVSFDELYKVINDVAYLVGVPDEGTKMVNSIKTRLSEIKDKLSTIKQEDRLSVFSYSFYGSTYAKGTSFDALVSEAGLINAATEAGLKKWPNVSKEKLIELDPDIILLPSWTYDPKTNADEFLKSFINDKSFTNLKAVKSNKVYILPDTHLQSNSQYMLNGVEDLVNKAYPGLLK